MDFLEKIFSNTNQEPKEEERFSHLIKRILSGNSSEINPNYLYELQSLCQTRENANKIMSTISHALDEFCDSPLPIFKALKLILLLLKLSSQTFTPAARNYLPEIQTIVNVSFDKPGAPHVNTIHRYANIIYLHLLKNIPLPEMKIPPKPKQTNPQPQPQPHPQNQRQPQRPGRSRMDNINNDEGSLFDSNDNNKYEESGSFLSGFLDLGPKRQQSQKQPQAQQPAKGSQNQEGPRMPAVFASGGSFQGIRSRISQPLDYGYEDENAAGEEAGGSLLSFNDASNSEQNNGNDLLVGAFDDIGNEPKTNNNNSSIDQTDFVFSGAEPASSNQQNTDINAPFNPFGADGFNPTFPDFDSYEKNDDSNKPSNSYRKPFVASGPKPKFDPSKMKKKPKIVPNTVPQDNFDPFGTGSAANAFDNIPKDPQVPPKKLSLAERLGQKPEQPKHEEQQKKPQQPSQNVFDLLGIPGSESDDGNEVETPKTTNTEQISSPSQTSKKPSNVFDALGDDFGSFEAPTEEKSNKVASNEEVFEPFGSSPEIQQKIDQPQNINSANVFDMLGDDAFTTPSTDHQQPSQPASNNELFGDFNSLDQTKPDQNQVSPSKNSSTNVFDLLDDNSLSSPTNSTSNQQKDEPFEPFGSQKQDKANDNLFEPFSTSTSPPQQQSQTESKGDLFESLHSSSPPQQQQVQKQESKNDDLFEPFGSSIQQQSSQSQKQENKNNDLFEPFSSSPQQQQKTESKGDLFEPFSNSTTEQQQPQQQENKSDDLFEPFNPSNQQQQQQQQSDSKDDLFEPFDSNQQQQQQPQKSSGNVFDMLGDNDFNTQQPSNQNSQLQSKPSASDDLFEPFGSVQQTSQTQQQQKQQQKPKNSSANVFDMLGDDAFTVSPSSPPKTLPESPKGDLFEPFSQPSQQQGSKNDLFEPFGSSSQQPQKVQQTNSKNDLFEPFGSSSPQQQPQQVQQTNSKNDLFESFGTSSPQPQKQQQQQQKSNNDLFEPFGSSSNQQQQQQKGSTNVFDMLDGNDFSAPQVSNKSSAAGDLFETFASAPSGAPQTSSPLQQQKNASANVFDMLGDDMFSSNPAAPVASNPGANLFDSFVSVPSATPQNSSNVFDLLDSTSNPPPNSSEPKKSNNPYDIFG